MSKLIMIAIAGTAALAASTPDAHAAFEREASRTACFPTGACGSDWAAGYTAEGRVEYIDGAPAGTTGDTMSTSGNLTAWVRVFGTRSDIAIIQGRAESTVGGARAYEVEVYGRLLPYLPPVLIYSHSWDGTFSVSKSWTPIAVSGSETYMVGPVPVTVRAGAKGPIGFSLTGSVGLTDVIATFTPKAKAVVDADAVADLTFASAGVYGELELIDVRLPITGAVKLHMLPGQCPGADWDLDVDLTVDSLDGEIGAIATLFGAEFRQPIFAWDGFSATYGLFDANGQICL